MSEEFDRSRLLEYCRRTIPINTLQHNNKQWFAVWMWMSDCAPVSTLSTILALMSDSAKRRRNNLSSWISIKGARDTPPVAGMNQARRARLLVYLQTIVTVFYQTNFCFAYLYLPNYLLWFISLRTTKYLQLTVIIFGYLHYTTMYNHILFSSLSLYRPVPIDGLLRFTS